MKLQFTNGYRPHFDQISRIMHYIGAQGERKKIRRQDIVKTLGIPENQVKNLTSMMVGFGLVKPITGLLTQLGVSIVRGDQYFEKIETLWIIHYLVSSDSEWVVWYRIVNQVIPTYDKFTVDWTANVFFNDLSDQFSERTISQKLPKEVGAVYASYTRSELANLSLIEEIDKGTFKRGEPVSVPPLAFLYSLLLYRDRIAPGSSAMEVCEIANGIDSPGRVMQLKDYAVRAILNELHDRNLIRLELFGNLDQVSFRGSVTKDAVLELIYGSTASSGDDDSGKRQLELDFY